MDMWRCCFGFREIVMKEHTDKEGGRGKRYARHKLIATNRERE